MRRFSFLPRIMIATIAVWAIVASTAHADLAVRVSVYDSDGNLYSGAQGQQTHTVSRPDPVPAGPPPSGLNYSFTGLQNLGIAFTSNIATTEQGRTDHGLSINLNYNGGVGANSDTVVIEFLGQNYQFPLSPPDVRIKSNSSTSSSALMADSVTMVSGVSGTNAGLPGTPGDTSGLLGLTTGDGNFSGLGVPLTPNPAVGVPFSLVGPTFSFYQAFTFADFTATGTGNLAGDSFIDAVIPEPTTLAAAFTALPVLAGFYARRRWVNRRK